jgi:hypothetical protein
MWENSTANISTPQIVYYKLVDMFRKLEQDHDAVFDISEMLMSCKRVM